MCPFTFNICSPSIRRLVGQLIERNSNLVFSSTGSRRDNQYDKPTGR